MTPWLQRTWPWWAAAALLMLPGWAWLAQAEWARQREAFDTEARIAHRLLSQRAVQHDAILATLALLQPSGGAENRPEARLPSVYPQLLRVLRREVGAAWAEPALQSAEQRSRSQRHAVLATMDVARAQATVLLAAEPRSYALHIDLRRMVPEADWPVPPDGPVRVALVFNDQTLLLQAGQPEAAGRFGALGEFSARKTLATASQPFELVMSRPWGAGLLPWGRLAAWASGVGAALTLAASVQRQRRARRRAEDLLRLGQVARLNTLGELAAGMAHELNQPLTAVLANTQAAGRLLDDDPADLPLARQAMAQAAAQARRASEVLGRLRRTVERPSGADAAQPVVMHEVVREALHLLEPECRRRGVAPRLSTAAPAVTVQADPVALAQIVHNLLLNALQAMDAVPLAERALHIAIDTVASGAQRQGRLSVSDTGPGVPPDALPRLFEPFFSTREGGLGLGLSLSQTLALGMGGGLAATNLPARGAAFHLTLPLAP